MSNVIKCPCNSNKEYEVCCEEVHKNPKTASSAEDLMRARYAAFVLQEIEFIYDTFHPNTRRFQQKRDIANWALESKWMQLEIVESKTNTVEFKAHYMDTEGNIHVHHEKSTFRQVQKVWYYVDGKIMS